MKPPGAILSRDQIEGRVYGRGEEVESNAVSSSTLSAASWGRTSFAGVQGG
jgi:hypothetical protein